jgi:negative regulator of flagellin synthesis FlgM
MNSKIEGPRLAPLPPTTAADAVERRARTGGDEKVGGVAAGDSVKLTDVGSELAASARSAGEPAPLDAARVAAVKAALQAGTFRIDPQLIADRLIAAERDLPK